MRPWRGRGRRGGLPAASPAAGGPCRPAVPPPPAGLGRRGGRRRAAAEGARGGRGGHRSTGGTKGLRAAALAAAGQAGSASLYAGVFVRVCVCAGVSAGPGSRGPTPPLAAPRRPAGVSGVAGRDRAVEMA